MPHSALHLKVAINATIIINQFYNQVQNTEKLIILKTNHILTLSYLQQHLRSYDNISNSQHFLPPPSPRQQDEL